MRLNAEDQLMPLERALYELMSSVSEDCYAAGWMDGTEYAVWDLARGARSRWGQGPGSDSRSLLSAIRTISAHIDRWIVWRSDDRGPEAVTVAEFMQAYNAQAVQR